MRFKDILNITKKNSPKAFERQTTEPVNGVALILLHEFIDRSRKNIDNWRNGMLMAEHPDDPRWFSLQDSISDIILDSHLSSVMDIRKAVTLNHKFYVDNKSGEEQTALTEFLQQEWFYDFLESAIEAAFYKYSVVQLFRQDEKVVLTEVPRRNICPQLGRAYIEVGGDKYINYREQPGVVEIVHRSPFGIINDVIPNVIWKRNALQAYAEFSEKYGQPLITAETANKAEIPRIKQQLDQLGETARAVLPTNSTIKIHDMAGAGDPEKCYLLQARFQDEQVSKRFTGSSTLADAASNRSQTEVHERTLDDKIATAQNRFISFVVNGKLFPILQQMGFPFDPQRVTFKFDDTEELTLLEHWGIVKEAATLYDIPPEWVSQRFNIPLTSVKKSPQQGFSANFH